MSGIRRRFSIEKKMWQRDLEQQVEDLYPDEEYGDNGFDEGEDWEFIDAVASDIDDYFDEEEYERNYRDIDYEEIDLHYSEYEQPANPGNHIEDANGTKFIMTEDWKYVDILTGKYGYPAYPLKNIWNR